MVNLTDVELGATRKCLKAFGDAAVEIGFDKPLGDYSEAQALRVIEAIVICFSEAMVAYREQAKYPPVRGLPPVSDPMENPVADLISDQL